MPIAPDTQIGPYKIVTLIGSGGMGEVYRAHDTRLRRDVALKILPASFTNDPDRLRRFEQEARAVAALSHANIVSVFDIGEANGIHYIVSELLEGESLRERIPAAGLPVRKAIELAVQFANGLAAAHDRGIVHRDLKPENVFVTKTGQVKILDFGLAKLLSSEAAAPGAADQTATHIGADHTGAGQILGTAGYMSPEQVRGDAVDHRADIFAFGSILYEMLCGQRAFKRNTSAETMTAILNDDPQDFPSRSSAAAIPPALERIVRHCLEKQPAQRFQSAHDIAFDLESISTTSSGSALASSGAAKRNRWLIPALAAVAFLAVGSALGSLMRPTPTEQHPKQHRITFRRGTIWGARFLPDGNLIYSAAWDGRAPELFVAQRGSTESRVFGLSSANILAASKNGDLAVLLRQHFVGGFEFGGMLARSPQGGGAPRDLLENVEYADWSPDGSSIAVARRVAGKMRIEYPIGKVVYGTAGWVSHLRVSPDGRYVAFADHQYFRDDGGAVAIIDSAGNKKTISGYYVSLEGLAWAPNASEVWFTGTTSGSSRELHAVSLSGKDRFVFAGTGTLTLYDISSDNRVLLARDDWRAGMVIHIDDPKAKSAKETDLSWHDWTIPRDMDDEAKIVSFDETGEAGGETGAIYVRGTNGSPAIRLGDGLSPTLSPDGKHALAMVSVNGARKLYELPTGAGEPSSVSTGNLTINQAYFFPDGHRILEIGSGPDDHALRLWIQDGADGTPRAISPEGVQFHYRGCISQDGKLIAALDPEAKPIIYHVDGSAPTAIPNTQDGDEPVAFTENGKSILVGRSEIPNRVFLIDLTAGTRKLFVTTNPPDPTGLLDSSPPSFSRDLKSYVYSYTRITSDLYVIDGLK
jgi:eukaryotic-like serine/threonine-protein kinase